MEFTQRLQYCFRSAQHQRATWYLRASVSLPARAGERDARQRQYRPIATSRLGMTAARPVMRVNSPPITLFTAKQFTLIINGICPHQKNTEKVDALLKKRAKVLKVIEVYVLRTVRCNL